MKEHVQLSDYTAHILNMLPKGLLLNTSGDKFNSMVIGWGNLGIVWGKPVFTVYVREGRYTRAQIDKTGEFTISIPVTGPVAEIVKICGSRSGRDINKADEARLTLEEPEKIKTPGVKEYPLTLECRVLYARKQDLSRIPEDIRAAMYPRDVDGTNPMANRDAHIAYIAEIVNAYLIR